MIKIYKTVENGNSGMKCDIIGSKKELIIDFNALFSTLESNPEIMKLFAVVANMRMEELKNDTNNSGN